MGLIIKITDNWKFEVILVHRTNMFCKVGTQYMFGFSRVEETTSL